MGTPPCPSLLCLWAAMMHTWLPSEGCRPPEKPDSGRLSLVSLLMILTHSATRWRSPRPMGTPRAVSVRHTWLILCRLCAHTTPTLWLPQDSPCAGHTCPQPADPRALPRELWSQATPCALFSAPAGATAPATEHASGWASWQLGLVALHGRCPMTSAA